MPSIKFHGDRHSPIANQVIETILGTYKIENFVENFAKSTIHRNSHPFIDNRTNALKGILPEELQALNVDTVRKDIPVSSALTDFQMGNLKKGTAL